MDTGLLIASSVFCIIGAGLIVSAFNDYKKFRFFKSAEMHPINSLKTGPVKIRGKVSARETLLSPFSKSACVYYRFKTFSKKFRSATGGPSSSRAAFEEVAGGENSVPFDIDDGTGRITINAEKADMLGLDTFNNYISASNESMSLKERIKKLKEMGETDFKKSRIPVHIPGDLVPHDSSIRDSRYDYIFGDVYIEPGSEMSVIGFADRLPDNRFQIIKRPILLVAPDDESIIKHFGESSTLRFFAIGIAMIVVGLVLIVLGM